MGNEMAIKKAKEVGVKNPGRLSHTALVRTIQEKEGNAPCYKTDISNCGQSDCLWRESCLAG
jgi:hypothetical protein